MKGQQSLPRKSPGYFRGAPVETMYYADLIDDAAIPVNEALWPPAGLTQARAEKIRMLFEPACDGDLPISVRELAPTAGELRRVQDFLIAYRDELSQRSSKRGKVPAFKFQSNDGWIVVPEECLLIAQRLAAYMERGEPARGETRSLVKTFIAFNEISARYGGYEVQ